MGERSNGPDMILGTPRERAVELEDFTDELFALTKHADALTEGHIDKDFGWRRTISKELTDGSTIYLYFAFDRLEDNYAAVTQHIPSPDGGRKIIERMWSNSVPSDKSAQRVKSFRFRPGFKPLESQREGFNAKDIARLRKLINMFGEG
jgi:hypothetical protein